MSKSTDAKKSDADANAEADPKTRLENNKADVEAQRQIDAANKSVNLADDDTIKLEKARIAAIQKAEADKQDAASQDANKK